LIDYQKQKINQMINIYDKYRILINCFNIDRINLAVVIGLTLPSPKERTFKKLV